MQRTTWTPQASENIEVIVHILHKDGTREYERTGNRIIIPLREPGLAKNDRLMLPFWIYRAVKTHIQRNEPLRRLVYGEGCPESSAVLDGNAADIFRKPFLPTLFDCIEIQERKYLGRRQRTGRLTNMIRLFIKKLLAPVVREVLEEERGRNLDAVQVQVCRVLEEVLGDSKNMGD